MLDGGSREILLPYLGGNLCVNGDILLSWLDCAAGIVWLHV